MTKIVCISDTHGQHRKIVPEIPDGDILIHAGDLTAQGHIAELLDLNQWLRTLPHKHKIVIAGNHDQCLEQMRTSDKQTLFTHAHYLEDSSIEVEGIKIYGSPWTPDFYNWYFMLSRGRRLREKWDQIPEDTDILVTHGPPADYCDYSRHQRTGCEDLRNTVERLALPLHVFGHIHGAHGKARNEHTLFVNCCTCSEAYEPIQDPVVIDWPIEKGK